MLHHPADRLPRNHSLFDNGAARSIGGKKRSGRIGSKCEAQFFRNVSEVAWVKLQIAIIKQLTTETNQFIR